MKKLISLFLTVWLATCLAGCAKNAETPNDVEASLLGATIPTATSSVVSDVGSEKETQEKTESGILQSTTESIPDKEKPETPKTVSSAAESSTVSETSNQTNSDSDVRMDYPTFTTEAAFKTWLSSGTTKTEDRNKIVSTLSADNTITYYRPAALSNDDQFKFIHMTIHPYSSNISYFFDHVDDIGKEKTIYDYTLTISASSVYSETKTRDYNEYKNDSQNSENKYVSQTVDGIEYIYYHNESMNATVIRWMQFGTGHSAHLGGHFDKINEVLPLLKLEAVTLRTDTVTE